MQRGEGCAASARDVRHGPGRERGEGCAASTRDDGAYLSAMLARAGLAALIVLSACDSGPETPTIAAERPAAPLDSMAVSSDARIDSSGALLGSFVGEGTSRAVHLLSSDTAFIGSLVARYRPDIARARDRWAELVRQHTVTLEPGPSSAELLAGSPLGHTAVTLGTILLHGGRCGGRGAQAELIIEDRRLGGEPPLRGPVLGSFHRAAAGDPGTPNGRQPLPDPPAPLVANLVARTAAVTDSLLAPEYGAAGARPDSARRLEINTLADVDAADVIPFRASDGGTRYAVSLRTRRIAGEDTLVAAAVMAWDSGGRWRQVIFRPTLLGLRGGALVPSGRGGRSVYWRRLQPVSDFAFRRDDLWMEQVDVRDGTVLWGIVQPHGNVVVAAAEVGGPCR